MANRIYNVMPARREKCFSLCRGKLLALLSGTLLCLNAQGRAQTLAPFRGAPVPHLERADWMFLGADAGARWLDDYSTGRMLRAGDYERFLPPAIADHAAPRTMFEGAVVAVEWLAARELRRHGKRRLARWVPIVDTAMVLPWAVHNLYLPRRGGVQ